MDNHRRRKVESGFLQRGLAYMTDAESFNVSRSQVADTKAFRMKFQLSSIDK